jgi:hypothetical protein
VSIVLDRKTEVPGDTAARKLDDVFTGAQEFDDAEREIGKAERISGFRRYQELLQGLCVGFLGQR